MRRVLHHVGLNLALEIINDLTAVLQSDFQIQDVYLYFWAIQCNFETVQCNIKTIQYSTVQYNYIEVQCNYNMYKAV